MKYSFVMELHEAIRRRSMVRSFSDAAIDDQVLDRILLDALRSPTAGNTSGTAWVVLKGHEETSIYFAATTDETWRQQSTRWEGLRRAPVVLLSYMNPGLYVTRYSEPDKRESGLDRGPDAWPIPYWVGDAAFGVMAVLLGAADTGLGACFLGAFRGEGELAEQLGVPEGWHLFGAVLLGRPDAHDHRSASLGRSRRPSERIHRGLWG